LDKLIITAAVTGSVTIPTQTPHLPITPEAIAADAIACARAGAAAVHLHARDPRNGRPSADPEIFREIIQRIKAESDVIIGITTGGGLGMSAEERLRAVPRFKPEIASFNLGSINFSIHTIGHRYRPEDYRFDWEQQYVEYTKNHIFPNTFGDMETFASTMREQGTRPEFEAYDVGHLYNLRYLVRAGFAEAPHWIQFVLGVLGALGNGPEDLMAMKATADRLFGAGSYRWSVIGVGYPAEFNLAAMAMIMGGHVRVGLEDNLFKRRGELATNAELVDKAVRLATELDREIATPDEARAMLNLKGKDTLTL
jgi:uncharacterized protein (DUF849 family)